MNLYIDPGTGSMLFTILIGIVGAGIYSLRMLMVKLRFIFSGGKKVDVNDKLLPLVIFCENKRYWNVFEPVCKELDRRGQDFIYLTATEDDPALTSGYEHMSAKFIGAGNSAFARLNFLKARIVVATTPGLDVYQWKRSKDVECYVHMLHAASDVTLYRMFGLDYYDAVLVSGQYQEDDIRKLEELRGLPAKEIVNIGIPYMDVTRQRLAEEKASKPGAHLISEPVSESSNPDQKTVLLAPSWGPTAIFAKYGSKIIETLLETGYHVIVRPHPQSFDSEKEMLDKIMAEYPESDNLEWNRDRDNFDVLKRSDILVSDFSGVIFDFSLVFDKPVIYTAADIDTGIYDAWWLDSPLWTLETLPKIGQELSEDSFGNLRNMIDECLEDPRFAAGRDEVRAETWEHMGEGAKCAADYLIDKLARLEAADEAKEEEEEDKTASKKAARKAKKAKKAEESETVVAQ